MKYNYILLFLILVLLVLDIYGQNNELTFIRSPKRYKYTNYLYEDLNGAQQIVNYEVEFKRNALVNNNISLHSISFGNLKCNDYISFSNDTIFYYPEYLNNNFDKKKLFILNEHSKNDTVFIQNFGVIYKHNALFEKKYYYSAIKDTVYLFKLWYVQNPFKEDTFVVSSDETDLTFNYIAISKKHGFIWVNYKYHGAEIEIRYY